MVRLPSGEEKTTGGLAINFEEEEEEDCVSSSSLLPHVIR
jgi:hypothetical protein